MPDRTPLVSLSPMRAEQARRLLSPPWVPALLAPVLDAACRARALAVPVHLVLRHPGLGSRFARALHSLTGSHGDLLLATDDRPELRGLPLGATVVVDPSCLDDDARTTLESLLDDGDLWLIAVTDGSAALPPAVAERLSAVVVDVPPLARRQLEVPVLGDAILQTLAARAGRSTPLLAPATRTRLAIHTWPGDVFELEAMLGRALAAVEDDLLEPPDLGLDGDALPPASSAPSGPMEIAGPSVPTPEPDPASAPAEVARDARLELLLAELAHEILNPLSTVKMLLGHLPQLLADAEAREALSGRADDAIGRVDTLLQNVVDYARLGQPTREPVAVGSMLDRLLAEVSADLDDRAIRVRRTGNADVVCVGDAEQLEYGFRNLLAGVVREVPPRDEFAIDTSQNGVVAVRFGAGDAAAARLRAMVADDPHPDLDDPTMLPLAFTLARAVIERNGGTLAVQPDDGGPTTLVVRLPTTTT